MFIYLTKRPAISSSLRNVFYKTIFQKTGDFSEPS